MILSKEQILMLTFYDYSACTNFLKQEVMTSTLWDLEVTGLIYGSQTKRAPCGAKNATLFFKHDVVCNA